MTASRADNMSWNRRTALWAKRQLARFLGIMRTSLASSRIGMFAFGNGHLTTSKQGDVDARNLFTNNFFGSNDTLLILEIDAGTVNQTQRITQSHHGDDNRQCTHQYEPERWIFGCCKFHFAVVFVSLSSSEWILWLGLNFFI